MDYVKEDWTRFRTLGTLPSMAGVSASQLKKLVVKELTDNALDVANECKIGLTSNGSFWVQDEGNGINGTVEEIAARFSVNRPLMTSKLLRLPTRGALGNGLRVVSGYVLATGGFLTVATKGRVINITPRQDGTAEAVFMGQCEGQGTHIEVHLGKGYKFIQADLEWGLAAQKLSGYPTYTSQASSPYWYDEDSFYELFNGYSGYARDVVASLEGCKGAKAGEITSQWNRRLAKSLTQEDTTQILVLAREATLDFNVTRLKSIGPDVFGPSYGHAKVNGSFVDAKDKGHLAVKSIIPFVIEAWVSVHDRGVDSVKFNVNRSPITGTVNINRQKKKTLCGLFGCELENAFEVGLKSVDIIVNVQTPYMPISSQGKSPTFLPMLRELTTAIQKAASSGKTKSRKYNPVEKKREIIEIIRDVVDDSIAKASGDGANRFSLRQLFYQVRPHIINELGKEPSYEWFGKCITIIENERGEDLPGIYRDDRGVIYHPHTGDTISLGTMAVEKYKRPSWKFNKLLYCEKEGFFQLLKDTKWPERHDCALITSKGTATRAARDVIDLLGETSEGLTFYCIHDADAAGTIIYQSLVEETLARNARKVKIIDLGLDPKEAVAMGLPIEKMGRPEGGGERPVARDIDDDTKEWLQTQRVELNAMTSPQFIAWLDAKMAEYGGEKLIPPVEVLVNELEVTTRSIIAEKERERVIAAANIPLHVSRKMAQLNGQFEHAAADLVSYTIRELSEDERQTWSEPVGRKGSELAAKAAN